MAYTKMQDVLDELASHNRTVFGINDAARIMGKPKSYVSKLLSNNRKVGRIERGKYYLKGPTAPDIYEIASQIVFPCYVSMFAALQYYSITEQSVVRYSVVSVKRHRPVAFGDYTIEFIKFDKRRFFGYGKKGNAYIATVEKAIVDSVYMGSPPFSYVEEAFSEAMHSNVLNTDLLMHYALEMDSKTVVRKISALLKAGVVGSERQVRAFA